MGAGSSKAADGDMFFESGVRVTQGLLEQMDGKPRAPRGLPSRAGGGSGGATSQARRPTAEADAMSDVALIRADRSLSRALEQSRRVGGLLLKAESEELQRVEALAEELVAREYASPLHPRPCTQQAEDCVACYAEHGGSDPLACAAAVQAYSVCAKAAWAEAVQRSAAP